MTRKRVMRRLPKNLRPRTLLALLLALSSACRSAGGGGVGRVVVPATQPAGGPAPEGDHQALFGALQASLADDDDELARRIVANLKARALSKREQELVRSAERVLTGRALVRALELELASEPDPEREGAFQLVLRARSQASAEVRLRLPPCDLKRLSTSMDARGLEGLDFQSKVTPALEDLRLAPAVTRRIVLLSYELPLGRALGVRERWRLETRSGEIDQDGVAYPAGNVKVAGCERERLSPLLAAEPASPGELAETLGGREPPRALALLELALRTPQAEREGLLELLAPVVARLAKDQPERIAAAEPALRWLTQNRDLGPDAAAWARYLAARAEAAAAPAERPADGLDLPARPRNARRAEDPGERR